MSLILISHLMITVITHHTHTHTQRTVCVTVCVLCVLCLHEYAPGEDSSLEYFSTNIK